EPDRVEFTLDPGDQAVGIFGTAARPHAAGGCGARIVSPVLLDLVQGGGYRHMNPVRCVGDFRLAYPVGTSDRTSGAPIRGARLPTYAAPGSAVCFNRPHSGTSRRPCTPGAVTVAT